MNNGANFERLQGRSRGGVPQPDGFVVRCRRQLLAVRREGYGTDGVRMALERLQSRSRGALIAPANAVLLGQSKFGYQFADRKRQNSHKNCVGRPEARSTRTRVDSWTKQAHSCLSLFLLFCPRRCK